MNVLGLVSWVDDVFQHDQIKRGIDVPPMVAMSFDSSGSVDVVNTVDTYGNITEERVGHTHEANAAASDSPNQRSATSDSGTGSHVVNPSSGAGERKRKRDGKENTTDGVADGVAPQIKAAVALAKAMFSVDDDKVTPPKNEPSTHGTSSTHSPNRTYLTNISPQHQLLPLLPKQQHPLPLQRQKATPTLPAVRTQHSARPSRTTFVALSAIDLRRRLTPHVPASDQQLTLHPRFPFLSQLLIVASHGMAWVVQSSNIVESRVYDGLCLFRK